MKQLKSNVFTFPRGNKAPAPNGKITPEQAAHQRYLDKKTSLFGERLVKLKKMRKSEDPTENKIALKNAKDLRDTTLELVPIAELNYKKYENDRAVYPFIALNKQITELNAEIRRLEDSGQQAAKITEFMQESMKLVAQNFADEVSELRRKLKDMTPTKANRIKRYCDSMISTHAHYMDEAMNMMTDKIGSFFLEK